MDYTRREVAEIAGVHFNTVRLWQRQGRLTPVLGDDGATRYARDEVEALIAERSDAKAGRNPDLARLQAEVAVLREQLAHERETTRRLLGLLEDRS